MGSPTASECWKCAVFKALYTTALHNLKQDDCSGLASPVREVSSVFHRSRFVLVVLKSITLGIYQTEFQQGTRRYLQNLP